MKMFYFLISVQERMLCYSLEAGTSTMFTKKNSVLNEQKFNYCVKYKKKKEKKYMI